MYLHNIWKAWNNWPLSRSKPWGESVQVACFLSFYPQLQPTEKAVLSTCIWTFQYSHPSSIHIPAFPPPVFKSPWPTLRPMGMDTRYIFCSQEDKPMDEANMDLEVGSGPLELEFQSSQSIV